MDRLRVTTMFTADAQLDGGFGGPALGSGDLHQPADTVCVDRLERRDREDALVQIRPHIEQPGLARIEGEFEVVIVQCSDGGDADHGYFAGWLAG